MNIEERRLEEKMAKQKKKIIRVLKKIARAVRSDVRNQKKARSHSRRGESMKKKVKTSVENKSGYKSD